MSTPIVTGCGLPIFGIQTCQGKIVSYYSSEATVSCPGGYTGGPFTSPAGKFVSFISQADADIQAQSYLTILLNSKCIPSGSHSTFQFQRVFGATDSFKVSTDGGAYVETSFDGSGYTSIFKVTTQIKVKTVWPGGVLFDECAIFGNILSGDFVCSSGTQTAVGTVGPDNPCFVQALAGDITLQDVSDPQTPINTSFNFSKDLAGSNFLVSGSPFPETFAHSLRNNSATSVVSATHETIINL